MKASVIGILAAFAIIGSVTGCSTDANMAAHNLAKDAESFKITRRVVFINGITDTYMLSIEGLCSIEDQGNQLEVTCKTGDSKYKKHLLGLSDNVTYFVEQLEDTSIDLYHYKVIFRPQTIIPDVDLSHG